MGRIRVSTVIDASPKAVWADVEDVQSHTEWMADAVAIRFLSDRTIQIAWDGLDEDLDRLGSGVYLVRLRMEVPDPAGGTGVYAPGVTDMRPQENWVDLMLYPEMT